MMRIRTYFAAAAATAGLLGVATPVAGAATTPAASGSPGATNTFVPPSVGPISVDIGRTIINGQIIDPGLHVLMPGVSPPPITWTPPQ